MAIVYNAQDGWGETDDVELNSMSDPVDRGYRLYRILNPRHTLDEPGNMRVFKHDDATVEFRYLLFIKDVDNFDHQVRLRDFPSLLAFFERSFAYSFLFKFELETESWENPDLVNPPPPEE